ncbi:MAG: hypothetical protein ACRBN8_22420 [Nannocystales bacterium]
MLWDVSEDLVSFHLGRDPKGNIERPVEPLEDGCPGGDQRCRLVGSLWPYYRRRDSNGGRVANILLENEPPSILALRALTYYEGEQDACSAEHLRAEREEQKKNGT